MRNNHSFLNRNVQRVLWRFNQSGLLSVQYIFSIVIVIVTSGAQCTLIHFVHIHSNLLFEVKFWHFLIIIKFFFHPISPKAQENKSLLEFLEEIGWTISSKIQESEISKKWNWIIQKFSQISCLLMSLRLPTETLAETIESGPLCITDLFQNKSVAYFYSMIIFL